MISPFTAFFDANVFYGARLRSLILYLAQTKLFRARWSDDVHEEWIGSLLRKRPDLSREDLETTRTLMNAAVPDCLVAGYHDLIPALRLPDPLDRHVLAAALVARAHAIVTFNEGDFPSAIIESYRLETRHPDDFLVDMLTLNPTAFVEAVRQDFRHYRRPPLAFPDYLGSLAAAGVPKTVERLRPSEALIAD